MFEQLRRKRMMIEQSVKGKKDEREGMSSVERRKLVENDINQYDNMLKTMQNFRKTKNQNVPFVPVNKTYTDQFFKDSKNAQQSRDLIFTPTVKDISPSPEQSALANQFYQLSARSNNESISQALNKNNNQVNFFSQSPSKDEQNIVVELKQQKPEININSMEEQSSHRESQPHIEDQEIKLPKFVNNSNAQSNNSQAIFFTSQFKEFLNNQVNSPKRISPLKQQIKEESPKIVKQQPLEIREEKYIEKEAAARLENDLKRNASGQSLAFSNDSSFKLSLNQSAIQDMITKKLSNELVVDSMINSKVISFQHLVEGVLVRQNLKDFNQFSRMVALQKQIERIQKIKVLDNLMIIKQFKFQRRKNEIKVSQFIKERSQILIQNCFYLWRHISKDKRQKIENMIERGQRSLKEKSFKTFKMLLFDRRINSQIDMYYLSKIFQAFKSVVEKQSKKQNQKAYRLYIKNLKKRMFSSFIQGCYNSKRQNQITQAAYNHYYYSLLGKYFQAWKQTMPREEKFIRLSMTTKNVLKETTDHRLFQTKTFDFYEVK